MIYDYCASVGFLCVFREETTTKSTMTLGPSATKSPAQKTQNSFVSSFSSHEPEAATVTVRSHHLCPKQRRQTFILEDVFICEDLILRFHYEKNKFNAGRANESVIMPSH